MTPGQESLRAELRTAKGHGLIRGFTLRPGGRATIYLLDGRKTYTSSTLETLTVLEAARAKQNRPEVPWREIADMLAERLMHHARCDEHPPARPDPACPLCADRDAYDLYRQAGGTVALHVDVYGGHGWLFRDEAGTVWLEHCIGGRWGACKVADATATDREARKAAMRHLRRRSHRFEAPQQLAGTHHGGGGNGIKVSA